MRIERLALLPLAALIVSASPGPQIIPLPGEDSYGEALIIPADSPVKFQRFDQYGRAHFSGRFALTGKFSWGCEWDCDGSTSVNEAENFDLQLIPDADVAARLPRWKVHDNDIAVSISGASRFTHSITTSLQRADLASGRLEDVEGRVSITVDQFETGLDCDSANASARFVAVTQAPKLGKVDLSGNFGCG